MVSTWEATILGMVTSFKRPCPTVPVTLIQPRSANSDAFSYSTKTPTARASATQHNMISR